MRKFSYLPKSIADEIKVPAGPIYITEHILAHISDNHGKVLGQLGLTPYTFARMVFLTFNQIRLWGSDTLLFVDYTRALPRVAAVRMEYDDEGGYWLVRTAYPASRRFVEKKVLLYEK